MTVKELIRKLQAIEPTCGELHVFYDEECNWVNFAGIEVRQMDCGGDWASFVALVGYDPDALPPTATASSSLANAVNGATPEEVRAVVAKLRDARPAGPGPDAK